MNRFLSGLCATTIAATFAFSSFAPAEAASVYMPKSDVVQSGSSDVVQIRDRHFRRNGNSAWYNGHRGYRQQRRGYRRHNGYWFPAGAFIAGAIVSGAIRNSDNHSYRGRHGSSHVQWCYDRYRSYRSSDNTFQPYHGPRQQCYSPY